MPKEQARVKCLLIAEQISQTLLGEAGTELIEVKTAVARIDGRIDLKSISLAEELTASLDAAGDLEFVDRAPIAPEPPAPGAAALSTAAAAAKQDPWRNSAFSYRPVPGADAERRLGLFLSRPSTIVRCRSASTTPRR